MMALEELEESEQRYVFLSDQRRDILESIKMTEEALTEIKRRSRERFRHAFTHINENFQHMFVELFGGGRGEMILIDEEDVLESGIDLIAQPPGKRLQNVLLLSGGEKAMAAIALVLCDIPVPSFALLHTRRGRRAPRRDERGSVLEQGGRDEPRHTVPRHHAQQADDGIGARALRRHYGGAGRVETGVGQI